MDHKNKGSESKSNLKQNDEGNKISHSAASHSVEMCAKEKPKETESSLKFQKSETDEVDALTSQLQTIKIPSQVLNDISIAGIVDYIKTKPSRNIITMVGAGISTAAGIPDFRSPGTGIYHNLRKFNLPYPQAIFELDYFKQHPEPFYQLATDLLPGEYQPTKCHYFIKLLEEKGLLLRHYTQNIDNLERLVGISESKLIEAHGTFYSSHCLGCNHGYGLAWLKREISKKRIPHCIHCNELVKPDIVFFGENLPQKFYQNMQADFKQCDLLVIMGSSLEVEPFASLALRPSKMCPRLIINLVPVGHNIGFQFGKPYNDRDVLWIGDCDAGCQLLADELGWGDDLIKLMIHDNKKDSCLTNRTAETTC